MKNKKEKIIAILLVVGLIVATGSISYAAFKFSGLGTKVNTITTGAVTMSYTESSNVLSMSGALPTTDTTGKGRLNPGEYFDFTVSSSITGDTNINYEIAVEELDGSTMSGDYIKFYLTKLGTDGSEQGIFGPSTYTKETESNTYTGRPANMMSLYTSSMNASETTTYRLRMYVSEEYNPQGDGGNLTYKARVNVYGLAGEKIEQEPVTLAAGLYDENDSLLISWEDLTSMDYKSFSSHNKNNEEEIVAILNVDNSGKLTSAFDFVEHTNHSITYLENKFGKIGKLVIDKNVTSITDHGLSMSASQQADYMGFTIVEIPDSVTSIGEYAFAYCSMLSDINYLGSKTQWNAISFEYEWNAFCSEITVHCTDGDIVIPAYY